MDGYECRACRDRSGEVVLDLGQQPACDYFPKYDDRKPDPVYPLQMWLCANCGLAQLLTDPTAPEEPKGAEPAALVAQAADAVCRVAAAGLVPAPGGGRRRGRCDRRLLRDDARPRPGGGARRARRPAEARRDAPAPI